MNTPNAYAVLSIGEIKNLLEIAQRDFAYAIKSGIVDQLNEENYCVVVRGSSAKRKGKNQVKLETAGFAAGNRYLLSKELAE